jgi:4-hydroxy-4-methyl-2-oxoglutarate aldolase
MFSGTIEVYGWCSSPPECSNAIARSKEERVSTGDHEEIAAVLTQLGSATLGESGGVATHRRLKPAWSGATVAGPAYPVRCTPGDNLAAHVGVTKAPAGSVLVVDVGSVIGRGYWGEVLTVAAQHAGILGLVLDGGVRDVAALEKRGFPVFSAAVALTGATKSQPGTVGDTALIGDVTVSAGDWIVGDVDGVAVIPRDRLEAVIVAGRAREEKEAGFFAALESGTTTVELLDLEASLISFAE